MITSTPYQILKDAIRQIPSLKYALGVVGIVSAVSITSTLVADFRIAIFGVIVMIILMVILVIFAKLTTIQTGDIRTIILVLMWFSLLLMMATATCLFTSVFFKRPVNLQNWIATNGTGPTVPSDPTKPSPPGTIEQAPGQDSDVRLVDCTVTTLKENSDEVPPVIDVKVRNVGNKTAFLKRAGLEVIGSAEFEDCRRSLHSLVPSSWTYDMNIEKDPVIQISHSLPPNGVDRFQIKVGRDGGFELTVYKVRLFIKYNENDQMITSQPFFIEMIGPDSIAGLTTGPVSKEEWEMCVERNKKNFGAIGYKIYKDDK